MKIRYREKEIKNKTVENGKNIMKSWSQEVSRVCVMGYNRSPHASKGANTDENVLFPYEIQFGYHYVKKLNG